MRKTIGLFIIGLMAFMVLPVSAVTVTDKFTATQDGYIDWESPDNNFASADDLKLSVSLIHEYIIFLGFSTSGIPSGSVITDIKLEISVKRMPLDDSSKELVIYETTFFDEGTLTATNSPAIGKLVSSGLINSDSRWQFTLADSSYVVNSNYYLAIESWTDNLWDIIFDGKTNIFNPPKLAVTYTVGSQSTTEPIVTTESIVTTSTQPSQVSGAGGVVVFLGIFIIALVVVYKYKRRS